jgi:O-antigen ligase
MKKINFFLFTMIYFAASIVLMGNPYRPLAPVFIFARYILILLGFSLLIFIYFRKSRLTILRFSSFLSIYIFIIWILFSLFVALSEILHHTFPFQGLFFLLIVPFIYFTVMPFITKISGPIVYQSLFAANFLYILISYLTIPVDFLPYTGLAANPNGFGQIAAIAVINGFFILITIAKKRKLAKILLITSIFLSLVSVILSSSRTSFIVVGIITLILSVHFTVVRRNFKPFLIIILVGLICWFSPIKEMFLHGMIEKFSSTYNEGNLFSGRTDIWHIVAKDASLFGNGEDYFQNFFEGAHNSIVYILGVYGIIPAILLAAFLLFLIVLAFLQTIQSKKDKLAIFPFVIIVTFTLFSMTEAMFGLIGSGISVAFYHIVGVLLFNRGENKRTKTVVIETKSP